MCLISISTRTVAIRVAGKKFNKFNKYKYTKNTKNTKNTKKMLCERIRDQSLLFLGLDDFFPLMR